MQGWQSAEISTALSARFENRRSLHCRLIDCGCEE
jgi:hypothetical protein